MAEPKAGFCWVVEDLDCNEAEIESSKSGDGSFRVSISTILKPFRAIETIYQETTMCRIKAIKKAITKRDIDKLRQLSVQHGFINDELRKKAWPLVLGIQSLNAPRPSLQLKHAKPLKPKMYKSASGKISTEYKQIELDIKRSALQNYVQEKNRKRCEAHLGNILHSMFDKNNDWHYIQGFNDVTSVIYAVCRNEQLAQKITQKVAETLFCDYILVQNDNDYLDVGLYKLIFDIIQCEDKELDKVLDNGHDFISISISWLLTWFAHHIKSKERICRIYDYCLSSDKMISSYLSAALIINCKDELLYAVQEEGISIFEFFHVLDWEMQDFDKLISLAERLHKQYSSYLNFKKYVSKYSKTEALPSPDHVPMPVTPRISLNFDENPFEVVIHENQEKLAVIEDPMKMEKNIKFRIKMTSL